MFNLKPKGKYHIELCKTVFVCLWGAKELKKHIKETLGLEPGQTSADGLSLLVKLNVKVLVETSNDCN